MTAPRDHGGGLDAAVAKYGGIRSEWLDLSTGINPVPYPLPTVPDMAWEALPDQAAFDRLSRRARVYWTVPDTAAVVPTAGLSCAISLLPTLLPPGRVAIPGPTYNEYGAAFKAAGWTLDEDGKNAVVLVHPNNPDGLRWSAADANASLTIIDESFADLTPSESLIKEAGRPGVIVLKSFGKFWGLAGLRLGFAIGDPTLIGLLAERLGPWQVSGPALHIGSEALADPGWADDTRARLKADADRLDDLLLSKGAQIVGGTTLFRLYEVQDAAAAQDHLAQGRVWSRIFPYAPNWLRLGIPAPDRWAQLEAAL